MSPSPAPPDEGAALEAARKKADLSQNEAARRAGMSGTRWRQIVSGVQSSGGSRVPVLGPPDTVAKMAQVVSMTPEDLEATGRTDAARELRDLIAEPSIDAEVAELRQEIAQRMAVLPPKRRERLERLIQEEEEAARQAQRDQLRRWAEVVKAADPDSD